MFKIDPNTNEVLQRYPSTASANLSLGLAYTHPGIRNVCKRRRPKFCGFVWQYEIETYVYSRTVIATNVHTGEELHFLSLLGAGHELFGLRFLLTQKISESCRTESLYRGYRFTYGDKEDGFVDVEYTGAVKEFRKGQKSVFKIARILEKLFLDTKA